MTCPQEELGEFEFSIFLPKGAHLLVEKGQKVEKGQLLAEDEIKEIVELDLGKLRKHLTVAMGQKVEEGQVIACQKSFLKKEFVFKSPVSGVVVELDEKGFLKVKTKSKKVEVASPLTGKVKETSFHCLVLEFRGRKIEGISGKGEKVCGLLEVIEEGKEEAGFLSLNFSQKGKILAMAGKISSGIYHKAEALGVIGLLGVEIPENLKPLAISTVSLDKNFWPEIKKHEGKEIVVSGEEKYVMIPIDS